jgi:hypothetical protein
LCADGKALRHLPHLYKLRKVAKQLKTGQNGLFERFLEQAQNGLKNYHFVSFSTKMYLCPVPK